MIVLASQSPRRQELMRLFGVDFTIHTADIDETMDPARPPAEEVARVSRRKAEAVAEACGPEDIIVAADTIVVIGGSVRSAFSSPFTPASSRSSGTLSPSDLTVERSLSA